MRRVKLWVLLGLLIAAGCTGEGVLNGLFGGGSGTGAGQGGAQGGGNQDTVDDVAGDDSIGPGRPLPEAGLFAALARNETDRAVLVTVRFIYNDTVVHNALRRVKPGTTTSLIGPEVAETCEASAEDFGGHVFPGRTFRFGIDADEDNPALYVIRDEPDGGNGNDNGEEPGPQPVPNDNASQNGNDNDDNDNDNDNDNENVNANGNDNTGGGGGGGGNGPPIIDCNHNGVPDSQDFCPVSRGVARGDGEICSNAADDDEDGDVDCADSECEFVPPCCSLDCNTNGVPDECDIASGTARDCNENRVPDACDIAFGSSEDCQPNGIPDECDIGLGRGDGVRGSGDPAQLLFPLNANYTLAMAPNDDGSSAEIPLGFSFDFYGTLVNSVFVNNNGNISFGQPFSDFTAEGYPVAGFPMVAPFWGDVDTRNSVQSLGAVWYLIQNNTLIVTWDNVGYYDQHGDKRNTFQLAISDGQNSVIGVGNNVAFSYDEMEWTTGDASDGSNGFGGVPATVGANRGDGVNFFLIGRFDHPGADYDGPAGGADGVSYLDGRTFLFSTATAGGNNIPPVATGFPAGNSITLRPALNETLNLTVQFLSPESDQSTVVTVLDPDGAQSGGLIVSNTPGNVASVGLSWVPGCSDAGTYTLRFVARDNFAPPGLTTVSLTIVIECGSTDCDHNGVPDECDLVDSSSLDCNENGVHDACDIQNEVSRDCNENQRPDECDIASGSSQDCDENGVPNECEFIPNTSCQNVEDCLDGQFCNGRESCSNGVCLRGCPPCTGSTPLCDEVKDFCFD